MRRPLAATIAAGLGAALLAPLATAGLPDSDELRGWIEEFKTSPKGPFERIRWFCADGTNHPAKPYPCAERGGGIQHGSLNERARALREGGYTIANVLADLKPEQFVGPGANLDALRQILIERFLVGWDDGWIFRGASSYRGALQIEDEEAGSKAVVLAMLGDPRWRAPERFFLLRETVRLLPIQTDAASAAGVRQLALAIAEQDPSFTPLRAKIHNVPDAGDATRVREYAASKGRKNLSDQYQKLAADIDRLYEAGTASQAALSLAEKVEADNAALAKSLRSLGGQLVTERAPERRLVRAARLSGLLRKHFDSIRDPATALDALQLSLLLENEVFTTGNTVLGGIGGKTRAERLELLDYTAEGLYGSGFLSVRQLAGLKAAHARLLAKTPSVNGYREELRYLARVPEWSRRWFAFNFEPAVQKLAPLEPQVHLYVQDRLRGSPLLFYGGVVDGLVLDANQLAGIEHDLFGHPVGAGLRALNPGLARGTLRAAPRSSHDPLDPNGIYLLPETTAELPVVKGILTRGEGSSLSHVQLLARNLGIPNVVVGEEHLSAVRAKLDTPVVLAVSPDGVVQLTSDGRRWDAVFGREKKESKEFVIQPDLEKLDLSGRDFLPLSSLRATDSGRTSGPKGANLGELKHFFGDKVPNGFVIPFGTFRALLEKPIEPGGPSTFEWMKAQYDAIAAASGERRDRMVKAFLSRLRDWIETTDPGPEFHRQLRTSLRQNFGADGTYGVFVRSDTNVEDLPGFTGAGLNLTVPNVVGYDNIVKSIHDVWASPFTERAFGWRQAHMRDPEYVFPAVVVQRGFPAEKSGVMVTTDVDGGRPGWLSVAVSEGVGGAVEGQATESLLIRESDGEALFLAQASAPTKAVLSPTGGIAHRPASGTDTVLKKGEIDQLVALARDVRERFVSLRRGDEVVPADIEFAFRDGRLALLQIRPFVQSGAALGSSYLARLDAGLVERGKAPVSLDGIPKAPTRGGG